MQTFVSIASQDKDELIWFCDRKIKGQCHSMTKFGKKNTISGVYFIDMMISHALDSQASGQRHEDANTL